MQNKLSRNIKLYYVLRALTLPFFWLPILYYYLTAIKGFSVAQTTILLGLQEFLLIFLEVPTGVVADKISRKFSVALGTLIIPLPFLFLPYTQTYEMVLLIFVVRALGKALVSGADSALLYDTLLDLGRTSEYKQIKTKSVAWMMAVSATAIMLGGWMGQAGMYNLALALPFPLFFVAFVAVVLMVEPESSRKSQQIQESNYLKHTGKAVGIVLKHQGVLVLAITFAFLEGLAVNMKWYYPALFQQLGFGLGLVGTIMSLLYVVKSLAYAVGSKLMLKTAYANTVFWVFLIFGGWAVTATMLSASLVLPSLVLILIGSELAINSCEELIHDHLESSVRATAMSFVNLLSSVSATVMIALWGVVIERQSVTVASLVQGLIFLGLAGLLLNRKHLLSNV